MSTVFATEAHRTEGHFRRLNSPLNKLKSLKLRFGTYRPTVSKRAGQCFEPLKTFFKKGDLSNPSEQLRCVISSNLKHYHSCNLGEWKNDNDKKIETSVGCDPYYQHPKKWQNSTQQRHISSWARLECSIASEGRAAKKRRKSQSELTPTV